MGRACDGRILKLDEGCPSGESFYERATGKRLDAVDRWGAKSVGDDVIQRAEMIRRQRTKLLWITRYVPSGLLLAGLLCFGIVMLPRRSEKDEAA